MIGFTIRHKCNIESSGKVLVSYKEMMVYGGENIDKVMLKCDMCHETENLELVSVYAAETTKFT